ncbi:metal-dependent phosphohydrolase [Janthinobacterium sp. ROICE36]|uniref:AAA family ATPase n=1 Tax=Janthinobacterium sp. ROICE36 TaxID=2048670 RepID=UPI000C7EB09D|nr:AAA family ATPase [Janthinobacterium sp. ROICE36]PLY39507.1 metal-dependent phosphohydrolase [Janthinobacterium sp. ROICE36]
MNWKTLQQLVPLAGQSPDFSACLAAFPQLELAKTTPQNPVYHAEGDVWTHTMMVIESLLAMPDYQHATRAEQEIVFLAALLHDMAKCSTTVIDPVTGAIGQPGHSRKGALDARIALWDCDVPFAVREEICRLINVHQVPFFALEQSRRGVTPEFTVRELSWQLDIRLLAMLAEADIRGRICPDPQRILDAIELFRELAREEGCYGQRRVFVDDHTRVKYFRGAEAHPDYPLFQAPGSHVIVMSGLPASGKNTWVDKHHPRLPVVSFDDARTALGLKHGKNEGQVGDYAEERARELLRKGEPFVWNATHLSKLMREKTLKLLYKYHAQVELVYLEQPRKELLRRNGQRDTSLSNKKLQSMLWNWEIPLPMEAHAVRYCVS